MTTYLSQGIDYIGFLNGKLRDLQGYATLAHELIQNADDARATTMVFDVRDEALVVENNRLFSDCGAVTEDACPWKAQPDIGHRCDFHRFRNVAGADKRTQESTTGAFGIGFISVYQITDRPELRSGQHHWRLTPDAPENQRIEALPDDGTRNAGTQFVLPWAIDSESQLRKRLHLQSVQVEQVIPALMDVFSQTLPKAILFLKHLNEIELRQNGQWIKRIGRTTEDGQILVQDGDQLRLWTVLRGSFDSDAATLRQQYPLQIETKRTADVAVAIAEETSNFRGVFSAWLPTEQSTELPFHINADFYPSTDRKRILLTEDHQGAWNRAAIQTAAALVADAIPELPRSLEPVELWSLFKRLKEVSESAEKGSPDPVYTSFWRRAQPVIIATPSVITSTRAWYPPAEVFLLEDADEEANLSLLEQMGLQIVHPDLRRFYTLFRSIGIRLLGLADIARALQSAGLTQSLALEQAPEWIRAPDARAQLAHEIGIVSKQNLKQETLENARRSLCQCAIALTRTGLFAPPAQLYRPTRDILGAFAALDLEGRLAAEENPAGIAQLVAEIQLESMLTILEPFAKKAFEQLWIEQKELLLSLIDWFVDHRKPLLTDHTLKQRLKQLPIWPSERTVHPLDDLVVAGSFQDPLHLASVLSHAVYHTRRDFMSELGFQRLNISTYASNLIPKAFTQGKVSPPVCDQLVLILAEHFGQLRDSQAVRVALEGCPLVACKDGVYRAPKEVYFDSNAVTDVFADLPVALVPSERQESVMLLYEWLGVAHEPRLTDVVVRIQQIVARPPDTRGRHSISELFRHLSNRKIMPEEPAIAALRVLRWLPARNDETRWFAPGEIYAVYSDYLFTTQANFLALDRHLQGSARTLIELLGIKDNPSTLQVVKHLQACAAHSQPVNREVYTFLNDHAQDPEIERLRNAACLLLDNNRYVFPSQVFWGEHGFGRYRYRLDHHYRRYDRLLTRLGVRELPQPSDAVAVMKEIAGAFQQAQVPLDEETYNVLIACWRQLGEALEQGNIPQNYLSKLRDYPLVPTEDRLLCPPTEMFLEDRSGIAERLHATDRRLSFKKQHTIARIVGAWQAMEAAGVRALSKAVKVTLIECEDRAPANDLQQKLSERKVLIRRVIEAHASDDQQWDLSLLDTLQVDSVSNLTLDYSIRIAERSWLSDPEEVAALF